MLFKMYAWKRTVIVLQALFVHRSHQYLVHLESNKINEVCFPHSAGLKCPRGYGIEFDESSVVAGRGGRWESRTKCKRPGEDVSKCREENFGEVVKADCSGSQVCTMNWPHSLKKIQKKFKCSSLPYLTLFYRCKPLSQEMVEDAKNDLINNIKAGKMSSPALKLQVKKFLGMATNSFKSKSSDVKWITKGIEDIETVGMSIAEAIRKTGNKTNVQFTTEELEMRVEVTNTEHIWTTNNTEVLLPIQQPGRQQVHVLTRLINSASLLHSQADVISVVMDGGHHKRLEKNLRYTLPHSAGKNFKYLQCGFWFPSLVDSDGSTGGWDNLGCYTLDRNETHIQCSCNHLTSFSVFWRLDNQDNMEAHQFEVLDWVSRIGLIISLIALVIAMGSFLWIHTGVRTDRDRIHLHLCFCLFSLQLVFLTGIDATEHVWGCRLIAVILHYLYLTTLVWSFLEGVEVWNMLHRVFITGYARKNSLLVAGYMPALLIVSCAVFYDLVLHLVTSREISYGNDAFCWIRLDTRFNLWFLIPASTLVILNFGFLLYAIYVIRKHTEKYNRLNILQLAKGLMALVFLLGSNFTIGFLYMFFQSYYLALFFNVLNSLQGVGILIFQVVLNPAMTNSISRKLRAGISSYFGPERLPSSQHSASRMNKVSNKGEEDESGSKYHISTYDSDHAPPDPVVGSVMDTPYLPYDTTQDVISTSRFAISTAHQELVTAHHPLSTAHHAISTSAPLRADAADTGAYLDMSSSSLTSISISRRITELPRPNMFSPFAPAVFQD